MKITVNPWQDLLVNREIDLLDSELYNELRKYGKHEPSSSDLALSEKQIQKCLETRLQNISKLSLTAALKEIGGGVAPISLNLELSRLIKQRSIDSAHQIIQTTGISFGVLFAALSKKQATGKQRTKKIANFEGPRIFFETRRKGWGLRHGVKKAWYCQNDPCNICQENEDEGSIPVEDPFPSGDYAPTAHPNCECLMSLII